VSTDADDSGGGSGCGGAESAVVEIGFEDEEAVISVCPMIKKKMDQSWLRYGVLAARG
jgi:hypothetical protein